VSWAARAVKATARATSRKWSLEAGRFDRAAATLGDTIGVGHQLVSGLIREAGIGPTGGATERSSRPQPGEASNHLAR
jgi:hypothetical protein